MAKALLAFFGGVSILTGFAIIYVTLNEKADAVTVIGFYIGGGFLAAGAPLLGFARVITLLERIERNTQKSDAL